jgi:redox-sensitive bicupin YhaK (pirin superfamily)
MEAFIMLQIRPATTLDGGDFGWLKARHHFKVTPEGNPANTPVGSLVVWNDDEIAPGRGFDLHGHANMEIISYIRRGAVTHRDSIGSMGLTSAGDVQAMSAGTGIRHSEFNLGQEPLTLFQIWLRPRQTGGEPRWDTRRFPKADRANQLVVLASGFSDDVDALRIGADARVLGATLLAGSELTHTMGNLRYAYLAPALGVVTVNNQRLEVGDGIAASDEPTLTIAAEADAEIVLVATN